MFKLVSCRNEHLYMELLRTTIYDVYIFISLMISFFEMMIMQPNQHQDVNEALPRYGPSFDYDIFNFH